MVRLLCLVVMMFLASVTFAQKTILVEKVGTSRRFFLHEGDFLKIKAVNPDTTIEGTIFSIGDSTVAISGWKTMIFPVRNIKSVYKTFHFPAKISRVAGIGGIVFFGVITLNHLFNNEQVFTRDMIILSATFFAISGISYMLSYKWYQIGDRWKIKILEGNIR